MSKNLPLVLVLALLGAAVPGWALVAPSSVVSARSSALQSGDGSADWPALRGNAARTGAVSGSGPAADPAVSWRFSLRSDVFFEGQPVVAADTVFVPGNDFPGDLYAIDAATGHERWHASLGYFTDTEDGGGGSLLAVAGGTVYVAGTEGEAQCDCMPPGALYALDAATGQELWRHSYGTEINQSAPAVVDGIVYEAVDDYEGGAVYAFDAATGAVRWTTPGDEPSFEGVPVAVHGGAVYAIARSFDTEQSMLVALDAASGAERWQAPLGFSSEQPPVATDDAIYVAVSAGFDSNPPRSHLIAFDAATGTERWRVQLPSEFPNAPTVAAGMVYTTLSTFDRSGPSIPILLALEATTGSERWRVEGVGAAVVAGSVLYASSAQGITALDAATGAEIWRLPDTIDYGQPVVGAGMLFATGRGGLIAVSGTTGPVTPSGAPAQPGTPPIAPVPAGAADGVATVAITSIEQGQVTPGTCYAIYPDTGDDFGERDLTPDGKPLLSPCDVDDPSGQGDGITRFDLGPGRYLAVSQPAEAEATDCGPRYPTPFQITAADVGHTLAFEIWAICEEKPGDEPEFEEEPMDEEEVIEEEDVPIEEDDVDAGTGSADAGTAATPTGTDAPVTVTILDDDAGTTRFAGGDVCVSARRVADRGSRQLFCDGDPSDSDERPNVIAATLASGATYEIDVMAESLPPGFVVVGIDEQGLRPLTDAGGAVTLHVSLREQPSSDAGASAGSDLYVVNPDGSGLTNLTNTATYESGPVWSPDGTRIAYEGEIGADPGGETDIWVMNADGSNPVGLAPIPGWDHGASWSPDGTKIAFNNGNGGLLYVVGADGTGLRELTSTWGPQPYGGESMIAPTFDLRPAWSPDGTRIAFAASIEGGVEIWTTGPDGSNLTRLTDFGEATEDPRKAEDKGDPFEIAVTSLLCPDLEGPGGFPVDLVREGNAADFEAMGCRRATEGEATFAVTAHTVDRDGAGFGELARAATGADGVAVLSGLLHPDARSYQLTETAPAYFDMPLGDPPFAASYLVVNYGAPSPDADLMPEPDREQAASAPAWSPDGTRLAFVVVAPGDQFTGEIVGSGGLYMMNADGSNVTRLTDFAPSPYGAPAWSPDGTKLLFASEYDETGAAYLYVVKADGSGLAKLTSADQFWWAPSWSPDGRITYLSGSDSGSTMFAVNADGTGAEVLVDLPLPVGNASWSPDGTKIVIESIPLGDETGD